MLQHATIGDDVNSLRCIYYRMQMHMWRTRASSWFWVRLHFDVLQPLPFRHTNKRHSSILHTTFTHGSPFCNKACDREHTHTHDVRLVKSNTKIVWFPGWPKEREHKFPTNMNYLGYITAKNTSFPVLFNRYVFWELISALFCFKWNFVCNKGRS